MKVRKFILLSSLAFISLSLASCGGSNDASKPSDSVVESTDNTSNPDNSKPVAPEEEGFLVEFKTNCDDVIPSQRVKDGGKVIKPNDPVKPGYTFDGWFVGDEKWVFAGYTVTEDITLEAHFTRNVYNITINSDNGTKLIKKELYYGDKLELEEPTKKGYVFSHWLDSNGVVVDESYTITDSVDIKAIWKNEMVISFDSNGGTPAGNQVGIINKYVESLPTTTREGYEFIGWYLDGKKLTAPFYFSYQNDITLKALWRFEENNMVFEELYDGTLKLVEYKGTDLNVVVPDMVRDKKVTVLAKTAFNNKDSIKSIKLGNYITTVEEYAFLGCFDLESVVFGEDTTTYGEMLFRLCYNLKTLEIRNNVELSSFFDSNELDNINNLNIRLKYNENDTVKLTDKLLKGLMEKTFTFDLVGKWPSITEGLFEGCSNVLSINVPNSIRSIGDKAFSGCSKITGISIPTGIKAIGNDVFSGCSKITNIIIPEGVTSIGDNAFSSCIGLTNITIPDSVKTIGAEAFYNCKGLKELIVPSGVTSIGEGAFSACTGIKEFTIPSGIANLSDSMLEYCIELKSITIPEGVVAIGKRIFANCKALNEIVFPNTLKSIGNEAFEGCHSLRNVVIPNSVTSIGESAFMNCTGLINISLPTGIKEISHSLFYKCYNLKAIVIPDGVISIGFNSFREVNLSVIAIPASVNKIYSEAFRNSTVRKVYYNGSEEEWNKIAIGETNEKLLEAAIEYNSQVNEVELVDNDRFKYILVNKNDLVFLECKDKEIASFDFNVDFKGYRVVAIGHNAFEDCKNLASIVIPDGIVTIEDKTFEGCSSLASVTIPNTVRRIGDYAFYRAGLLSLEIPDGVKSIGDFAFSYCEKIKEIIIPNSVIAIEAYAFSNCIAVEHITISNQLSSIEKFVFSDCKKVRYVIVPEGIEKLGDFAFADCDNLVAVVLPSSIKAINKNVFYKEEQVSNDLKCIFYNGSLESWSKISINKENEYTLAGVNIEFNTAVNQFNFVDNEKYSYLLTNTNKVIILKCKDKNIANLDIEKEFEGYEVICIGSRAFSGSDNLVNVTIPGSVKVIGDYAFSHCERLEKIVINEGVTHIQDHAFSYNPILSCVVIPNSVEFIGRDTFYSNYDSVFIFYAGTQERWDTITLKMASPYYYNLSIVYESSVKDAEIGTRKGLRYLIVDSKYIYFLKDDSYASVIDLKKEFEGYEVVAIAQNAFYKNKDVSLVKIPSTVVMIETGAFDKCSNDLDIWCEAEEKPEGWNNGWNAGNYPVIWGERF